MNEWRILTETEKTYGLATFKEAFKVNGYISMFQGILTKGSNSCMLFCTYGVGVLGRVGGGWIWMGRGPRVQSLTPF